MVRFFSLPTQHIDKLCTSLTTYAFPTKISVQYGAPASTTSSSHVSSVAICVGSGGDMLSGANADVYLTGEMAHVRDFLIFCIKDGTWNSSTLQQHVVLAAVAAGKHVILCTYISIISASVFDGTNGSYFSFLFNRWSFQH
jgi:hypothetical protein